VAVATLEANDSLVRDAVVLAAPVPHALRAPTHARATRAVDSRFEVIVVS
jgi:hypothetical protein